MSAYPNPYGNPTYVSNYYPSEPAPGAGVGAAVGLGLGTAVGLGLGSSPRYYPVVSRGVYSPTLGYSPQRYVTRSPSRGFTRSPSRRAASFQRSFP